MKLTLLSSITALSLISSLCIGETYTWTDENGKKNYGDNVPPAYKDTAKVVEVPPLNTMSMEESVRLQNQATADRLRREDALKKSKLKQSKSKAQNQSQSTSQKQPPTVRLTKEYCRDLILNVKERTACFRAVAEQNQ